MSDFLRDLSPARAHDSTRAVPLLRSSFETMQPLRSARLESTADVDSPVDAQSQLPIARTGTATRGPRLEEPSRTLSRSDEAPLTSTDAKRPLVSPTSLLPEDAARDRVVREPRVDPDLSRTLTSMDAMAVKPAAFEARNQATNESRVNAVRTPTLEPMTTPMVAATLRSTVRAAQSPTASAPLTARALAMKTPATEPRPVVHVTIDRIEVRAPVESVAPKPPSRPRASASVSLNEYLRGHDANRRGGVS